MSKWQFRRSINVMNKKAIIKKANSLFNYELSLKEWALLIAILVLSPILLPIYLWRHF